MLDGFVDGREPGGMGMDGRRCGFSGLLGGLRWGEFTGMIGDGLVRRESVMEFGIKGIENRTQKFFA